MLLAIIKYTVIEVAKYYYMDYIKTRLKRLKNKTIKGYINDNKLRRKNL